MKRPYTTPRLTRYKSLSDLPAHLRKELESHPFVVFNRERTYTFVSDSFAQMLGYKSEDLVGKRIDDILAPNTVDVDFVFDAFLRLGEMDGLWLCQHRDGRKILFHYRAVRSPELMYAKVEPLSLLNAA